MGAALAIIFTIYLLVSLYFIKKKFMERAKAKKETDSKEVKVNNDNNK